MEVGKWNNRNGEGLFGTRPFVIYGQGPTEVKSGLVRGFTRSFTAQDIRFTRDKAGKTLYAYFLEWPGDGATATIESLKTGKLDKRTVTGVTMIGGGACDWSQDASGFKIRMPAKKPDGASYAYGFKISFGSVITFDGKPVQVFPVTATEGQGQR